MSDRPHCLWESPDGQTAIYLSFDVVDAINAAILEAASSAPLRGAEVGGLLLGKAEKRTRLTVWVDRIELLPCRYLRGPSFHLEAEDAPDLTRPEIAGYFRSHTRKDLFLGPDDLALLSEHFARPEQVALLVKPFQSRPNLGGFFLWRDGKINGSASVREFTFHRRELGGGEPVTRPSPPALRKPYKQEDDIPETVPAESKKRPVLLWALLAILTIAATGSVGYLLFERTKPISPTARSAGTGLRLSASEGDHNVTLTWDKDSTVVASALKAVIEIQEGTFQKTLEIGAEQLRAGKIIYSRPVAIADTVSFSLRVFPERGKPALESVQIISNRPLDLATQPTPPLPSPMVQEVSPTEVATKEKTKPTPPKSVELPKPVVLKPVKTEPVKAEPKKAELIKAESIKTDALKAEVPKVETPKAEPPKLEAPKTDAPVVPLRPAPRRIP